MLGYAFQSATSHMGDKSDSAMDAAQSLGVPPYYVTSSTTMGESPLATTCYQPVDPEGNFLGECLSSPPGEPQWHVYMVDQALAQRGLDRSDIARETPNDGLASWLFFGHVGVWRVLTTLMAGLGVAMSVRLVAMRKLDAQNLMYDNSDINQYTCLLYTSDAADE